MVLEHDVMTARIVLQVRAWGCEAGELPAGPAGQHQREEAVAG